MFLHQCVVYWTGFPLEKAVEYTTLRKPFLINDLEMQFHLQDRRDVYQILQKNGIETPRFAVCDRSENKGKSYCYIVHLQN